MSWPVVGAVVGAVVVSILAASHKRVTRGLVAR